MEHAIIPAAGFGTRFLPWTKAVPKELIPVGDKPVLHYVVAEAAAAGITEIVLVISKGKEAICRYFEPDLDLERTLFHAGKSALLAEWVDLMNRVNIRFVYQPEMRGLGDAVLCGAEVMAGCPFAVLLGDTIIAGESPLKAMVEDYRQTGFSSVAVQPVPPERAVRYGVCGGREVAPQSFKLDQMEEKPLPDRIPVVTRLDGRREHMAFAARYAFAEGIVDCLRQTVPGRNGEIQLTDAMDRLLHQKGFHAHLLTGKRLDIGNPDGLKEALDLAHLL